MGAGLGLGWAGQGTAGGRGQGAGGAGAAGREEEGGRGRQGGAGGEGAGQGTGRAQAGGRGQCGAWILAWNWAGIFPTRLMKFETNENALQSEIRTISIYPALEGLGFRGPGFRVYGLGGSGCRV